jgi:hypothetical protein
MCDAVREVHHTCGRIAIQRFPLPQSFDVTMQLLLL